MKPSVSCLGKYFLLRYVNVNGDKYETICIDIPNAMWVLSIAYRIGTVQRGAKLT